MLKSNYRTDYDRNYENKKKYLQLSVLIKKMSMQNINEQIKFEKSVMGEFYY